MTGLRRLFWIEARRNVGLLCLPLLISAGWVAGYQLWHGQPTLWAMTSKQILAAMIYLAPAAGGLAAWMASRGYRRGIEDLLQTTPRSPTPRDLVAWGAATFWVVVAYGLAGLAFASLAVRDATWGRPLLTPIAVGLLAIVAFAAIGGCAATIVRSRFTAPLIVVGLFLAEFSSEIIYKAPAGPNAFSPRLARAVFFYSPWSVVTQVDFSVFRDPRPAAGRPEIVWLAGLAIVALTVMVLWRRRSIANWLALVLGLGVLVVGAVQVRRIDVFDRGSSIPYTPVCTTPADGIPVCVHPAYAKLLNRTTMVVNSVMAPVIGIPGVPTRAAQPDTDANFIHVTDGTLFIQPGDPPAVIARQMLFELVGTPSRDASAGSAAVRSAIMLWLIRRAGYGSPAIDVRFGATPAIDQAVARFAALTPDEQHAWLESNWAALEAEQLTLDDLP